MPGWHISGGGGGAGIGGSTGATDDAILIADGTGGATAAASAATLTAAGSLTIPSGQRIFIPDGSVAAPALSFTSDPGAGFYMSSADNMRLTLDGSSAHVEFRAIYLATLGYGGMTMAQAAAATPSVCPDVVFDNNTGLGRAGADKLTLVAGGAEIARASAGVSGVSNGLAYLVPVEPNTAGSGTPNAIAATESGTVYTNEGSGAKNYEALPTAVAGYQFTFIVQDADGMRIVANTDDTIRVIDKVTAAAGYIESTTIGSTVTLVSVNAVEWYAIAIKGTWTDGTFTYDDTSLTTP